MRRGLWTSPFFVYEHTEKRAQICARRSGFRAVMGGIASARISFRTPFEGIGLRTCACQEWEKHSPTRARKRSVGAIVPAVGAGQLSGSSIPIPRLRTWPNPRQRSILRAQPAQLVRSVSAAGTSVKWCAVRHQSSPALSGDA